MVEVEGIKPSSIRFIPNGIPTPQRKGHDLRAELGLADGVPVVATVGQLRPEKALEVLVEATARLAPEFPDLRVLIVGHGPVEGDLKRLAVEAGLDETVLFLGRRNDVPDVLAGIDLAVCCSDHEGSPLSVMEYMAAGRPVVATSVGGVPDLIEDGVHGLLVPARSPDELAAAIASLLSDRERAREMGERARARQQEEFTLDAFVRRVEDLYEELFSQTARARDESWEPFPRD